VTGRGRLLPCRIQPVSTDDVLLKSVTTREARVHALVCQRLPDLTPEILEFRPTESGRGELRLPDLRHQGWARLEDVLPALPPDSWWPSLTNVCEALVRLHRAFRDDHTSCHALSLVARPTQSDLDQAFETVDQLTSTVRGVPYDVTRLSEALRRVLVENRAVCHHQAGNTLLHGDLHFRNVLRSPAGAIVLIDWGEACWGQAAWDLALLPEPIVRTYWRCRNASTAGAEPESTFLHGHRVFAVIRGLLVFRSLCRQIAAGRTDMRPAFHAVLGILRDAGSRLAAQPLSD
jgi:hypothetical protein